MANVALIFGGPSEEHDVSLTSAKLWAESLLKSEHHPFLLGITKKEQYKLIQPQELSRTQLDEPMDLDNCGISVKLVRQGSSVEIQNENGQTTASPIEVAFPICHGPYGEDGQLQSYLESLHLPYIGTGVEGCRISLDKAMTKSTIAKTEILQVPYIVSEDKNISIREVTTKLSLPFFVKPANMGSSVGISKVKHQKDFEEAVHLAFSYDSKIVLEKGIEAREVECAILELEDGIFCSKVGEIFPNHEYYSYEAKYLDSEGARYNFDADLPMETITKIQDWAKKAFRELGCSDYARADFFVSPNNTVFFNEINTHPGCTPISMFPTLLKNEGWDPLRIVNHLIETALSKPHKFL